PMANIDSRGRCEPDHEPNRGAAPCPACAQAPRFRSRRTFQRRAQAMTPSKQARVPILAQRVQCPCGEIFDYPFFEGGFCDFEAYVGSKSRTLYRLDLTLIYYQGKNRDDLLRSARAEEGELWLSPDQVTCQQCGRAVADCTKLG